MSRPPHTRRLATRMAATAATVLTLIGTGCTSDGDPGTTPTSPHGTSAPSVPAEASDPAPTPTSLTRQDAEASAREAIQDYLALFAEISADPDRDVSQFEQVATGRALDWATHQITTWRDAGQRGIGAQVASEFNATNVVLDPDSSAGHDHPTVELTACIDVSGTDVVDKHGNSAVSPDRPSRALVDYVVQNTGWPTDDHWLVVRDDAQLTDSNPPEFVPCD